MMLFAPDCGCLFALCAYKKILNERGIAWIHRNYCLFFATQNVFKEAFRSDKAVKSHLLLSQKNLLTP